MYMDKSPSKLCAKFLIAATTKRTRLNLSLLLMFQLTAGSSIRLLKLAKWHANTISSISLMLANQWGKCPSMLIQLAVTCSQQQDANICAGYVAQVSYMYARAFSNNFSHHFSISTRHNGSRRIATRCYPMLGASRHGSQTSLAKLASVQPLTMPCNGICKPSGDASRTSLTPYAH